VWSRIGRGCKANGCALIAGDGADAGLLRRRRVRSGGVYRGRGGREKMVTGAASSGDVLVGLPSTGLHTNGYSLARKLFFELPATIRAICHGHRRQGRDGLMKTHRSYCT